MRSVRVCFLLDDTNLYGLGHLSRCTAVAEALWEIGICSNLRIRASNERSPQEQAWGSIVHLRVNWFPTQIFDIIDYGALFFDSYSLTLDELKELYALNKVMYYFDDTSELAYERGTVINAAVSPDTSTLSGQVEVLSGYKYAALRRPFWDISPIQPHSEISNILIAMGSMDVTRLIPPLVDACAKIFDMAMIHVLATDAMPHLPEMRSSFGPNIQFHINKTAEELADLYSHIDLAFTAGGQTSLELLRYAIPCGLVSVAANQSSSVTQLAKQGIAHEIKPGSGLWSDMLEPLKDYTYRKKLSENCRREMDGQGARRIAQHLLLSLRKETLA